MSKANEYRVLVENVMDGSSASRASENAAIALYEAVKHSGTITPESLIIGVIATALIEGDVDEDIARRCRDFLDGAFIPENQRKHVEDVLA